MHKSQTELIPDEGYTIAKTTLAQLSASKLHGLPFIGMVGAKEFKYGIDGSLVFKVAGKKINRVVVNYNRGSDLYDIEFWDCRILDKDPYVINNKISSKEAVYNDEIAETIAREIGLF